MGGDDVQASTCYVREVTIVMTAGTAAHELAELTPSSEVKPLVSETIDVLSSIGAVDLEAVCGEAFSDSAPKDTKKCDVAMGELFADYHKLKTVLDQWKPYT